MAGAVTPQTDDQLLERHATALHKTLTDLARVYQFRDRDCICCHGVSVTQSHALDVLARTGALTLNELAAELYLEKSTASRVVTGLETKGYIERSRDPEDRRALQIELTPEGRTLHERIEADLVAEEERLLEDFEPEVREGIVRVLGRLARAMASRVDTTGGTCSRVE